MSTWYGSVYFIWNGAAIKIGHSGWPLSRMDQLQASTPTELKMLATMEGKVDDEQKLHHRFAHLRVKGEWFRPAPELIEFIKALPDCKIDILPGTPPEPEPPVRLNLPAGALDHITDLRRRYTTLRNRSKDFCAQQRMTNILNLCENILKEPDRTELWAGLHSQIRFHENQLAAA